jgi:hypothetical protein
MEFECTSDTVAIRTEAQLPQRKGLIPYLIRIRASLQLAYGGSAAKKGALMRILVCLFRNMLNVSSHVSNTFSWSSVSLVNCFRQTVEFECT